jgi:antitoxin (DNA-binding transcriptional repressor) of toxin-antitoxin stability system
MPDVDVVTAAKRLSKLVAALESGESSEVILTRDGRPAARLIPLETQRSDEEVDSRSASMNDGAKL